MTTPTLDSLKPLNGGLEASWTNSSPYDNIFDAFLLVVKDHDNSTIKINLSEGEALEESYAILNLDNNFAYSVTYNQVNLDSNGGVNGIYSSNTLTATPSIPPLAPVIVDIYYHDVSNAKVKFTLPSGTSAKDYKSISFNKFNDNSNTFLGIQTVDLSGANTNVSGAIYETTITDLSLGEVYAVSSFLKNECGYGALSNTFTFKQLDNAIPTPTLNYVESGLDSKIKVNFTVKAYSNASPMNYHIEYKEDVQDVWTNVIGEIKSYTGSQMVMTVEVDGLTNLKNYQVKVKCFEIDPLTAVYNDSLYSDIEKGVPMLMPTFSLNPELSVIRDEDGLPTGFKSTWDYTETQGGLLNVNVVSRATYTDASGVHNVDLPLISALNLNQDVSVDLTLATDISLAAHLRGSVPPANLEYFTYTTQQVDVSLGNPYYNVPPPQNAIGFVDAIPLIPNNLTYIAGQTSTSSTSGVIQIFFEEGANNNEVKTQYICNLYTLDPSINTTATPLKSQTVTEENATFKNLDVNNAYYWVSVVATNYVGSSPPATTPSIAIPPGAVPPMVTNISSSIDPSINIKLSWVPVPSTPSSDYTYAIYTYDEFGISSEIVNDLSGNRTSYQTDISGTSNVTFGIQTTNTDTTSAGSTVTTFSTVAIYNYIYNPPPDISSISITTKSGVSTVKLNATNASGGTFILIAAAADSTAGTAPVNIFYPSSSASQTFTSTYAIADDSDYYGVVVTPYGSDMYDSSTD